MGIRSMNWNEWIEVMVLFSITSFCKTHPFSQLDREFFQFHKIKERRLETRRDRLVQTLPATPGVVDSGHAACKFFFSVLSDIV